MRKVQKLVLLFVTTVALSACGKWPPYKDDIVENFHDRRAEIEALEAAFNKTDYWDVTFGPGESAKTRVETERGLIYQKLEDGVDWYDLLRSANVHRIRKTHTHSGNDFELLAAEKKGRWFNSHYTHESGNESEFNECQDEYSDIPCGTCSISLDAGWWFQTMWSPRQLLSDEYYEKVGTGELGFEESSELREKAYRACFIDGYTRLGYRDPEE